MLFYTLIGLGKVSIKKTLKVMEFSILGGGVYPISITFFRKKNVFFQENNKDDQNALIHPEI